MAEKQNENELLPLSTDNDFEEFNIDYDGILKSIMNSVAEGMKIDLTQGSVTQVAKMARMLKTEKKRIEQLGALIKVSTLINSSLNIDEKLEYILESITDVLEAEASSILLKDENKHKLVFRTATGEKAHEVKLLDISIDEGIAGWVASEGKALNVPDVTKDPRYSPKIAESVGFHTRSIICVPFVVNQQIIGSLEVINRLDGKPFNSQDLSVLIAFGNQAAISLENSMLYRDSTVDGLTTLYNQRYFKGQLKIEFARASRYETPLSLFMLDLDDFKKYNDNYGHLQGDQLLGHVARIVKSTVRESDIACRYGGEEITVILPEVTIEKAKNIAERLRSAVEKIKESKALNGKGITCSIGISNFPQIACNHIELLEQADRAMYQAKKLGKNGVVVFESEL